MRVPIRAILALAVLLLVCSSFLPVSGSHFRGAIVQWSPVDPAAFNGTITVTHRIAWRRGTAFCDESTIASGQLIGENGNLQCRTGCFGTVGSMRFQCTDFSVNEDWSSGQLSYAYDISGVDYFEASYTGCCWIPLVTGGSSWEVRVKGNLTVRPDTGRINSSPITAISPILRLQHGCNHTIDIPVDDLDDDEVRCRWARGSDAECSGVCDALPGAILNERNCELQYEAVGSSGWYAVALQIEDYASPTDPVPLSSVPVQFMVLVFSSDQPCSQKPEFAGVTRAAGSCIGVPFNTTFHEPLIAMAGGPDVSIVAIDTVSPQGLRKSSLDSGPGGGQWHVNITWTPNESQFGPNIFCYTAKDSVGLASDQNCVTLLGGVEAPNVIPGSFSPTGQIFPNHTQWSIQFNQKLLRPTNSRFIRIIREDGREVVEIDVAISPSVMYPEGSLRRELKFMTNNKFTEKMQYYVLLDPGVAVGPEFCGPESPALRDPSVWVVSIADVTPPSLVFLTFQQFSNENFTINWRFNEEVTATCTLQTPTDQLTEICDNGTFTRTHLKGGLHFLFVQGTDLAGNTGRSMRYDWIVDVNPPRVILKSVPNLVSNMTLWTFTYECLDESGCVFSCSVHEVGNSLQHSPCGSSYRVDRLLDGNEYEFAVFATDDVGNIGPPIVYRWKIDITPPLISTINDVTVPCGQDLSPNTTGVPQVTDNEDPQPTVKFEDMPSDGCGFQRLWHATDKAGNTASQLQLVTLTSPLPPEIIAPSVMFLPCGSVEDAILNVQELKKGIIVQHPCDRPVEITFTDSADVDRCGFSFSRTWLVEDDCGGSNTFQQTIRILDQQFPDAPENGQLNTDINQPLIWPQYPGAFSYEVYVWRFGNARPTMPTAVTTLRRYQPSPHYPPGTKMSWQVEYRTATNVTVPSPVWGFETEAFPDFAVTDIMLPPFAFSGQDFDVSWTVINVGNLSSGSGVWYDQVRMGPTRDISNSRIVATVQQRRILDPNDGYVSQAGIDLGNTDIGTFYLFVEADIYRRVNDIDRSNNKRISTLPLQVRLTPPPNLEVQDVNIPRSSFSGESISIGWTVENTGSGVTATDQWFDRVYWSNDEEFDTDDLVLGEFRISGALAPGATYTQRVTLAVPKAIFGDFFIIVLADIYNQVYEHTSEDDNTRITMDPINVVLSPPPDLVVSSIVVGEEHATGSVMVIKYTVTNNGAGAPFEPFWTDKTVLIEETSGVETHLDTSFHYGTLQPGESYSREVQYIVSPNLATGQYNLTVFTDARGQVFEFQSDENNMLSTSVRIILRLSDLTVSNVEASLSSSSEGNEVGVNYTVVNIGSGRSVGSPWIDRVAIADSPTLDADLYFVADYSFRSELSPQQNDSIQLLIKLSNDRFGILYVHVFTDYYNRVKEESELNNRRVSMSFTAPLIQPDLAVENVQVGEVALFSGNQIQITWMVANLGNGELTRRRWVDSVYLDTSSTFSDEAIKLGDITVSDALKPNDNYVATTSVRIPNGLSGGYYLFVRVDNLQQIDEADDSENNVISTVLFLELPPSPDLAVKGISVSYSEGDGNDRILSVQWTVINLGNSMQDEMSWTDQLFVSGDPVFDRQNAMRVADMEVVVQLRAYQEYFIKKAVILPNDVFGSLFAYVELDSANDIAEISAEDNNIGRSESQLSVPKPVLPQITIQINSDLLPSSAFAGEALLFRYDVSNVGKANLPLSSWTDGVYLVEPKDASRRDILAKGFLLDTILHNRGLESGEQVKVSVNISIPYLLNEFLYFAAVMDINGNLGNPTEIGLNGDILSQTSKPLLIEQGPLPDLVALPLIGNLTTRGGQPVNVTLQVANIGNNTARGVWYGAVYLSQDAFLDPFDMRLKTVLGPSHLDASSIYNEVAEIFVPFDLPSASYYLFYEVDVGNRIPEEIEHDNNIEFQVFIILGAVSTDIAVVNVNVLPMILRYEDEMTASWGLRNNGSIVAEGYKCDTAYLSEDDVWDVTDHQLGETRCGSIVIPPYDRNLGNDLSFQLSTVTPFIAQQDYTGIVRSRSNIRDPNLANNIGITQGTLSIQAQSISLNSPTVITLQQGQNKVYRIDSVPGEETLVATLKAATQNTYHDLFLRYEKPPTGFDYDAFSQRALSVDQKCVVRNTRNGTYYLRVESSTSKMQGDYSVEVLVKIATFEITEIIPSKAAPLGDVTLLFSGTVFGYAVEAYIYNTVNPSELFTTKKIFWFSSEEVYATFDITGLPFGKYAARLVNRATSAVAELTSAIEISNGIPGQISLQLLPPRPLRAGENGQLSVFIQNTGNTDILSPLISVSSDGNVLVALLHGAIQSDEVSATASYQSVASRGPAGILPPGGDSQLYFQIIPGSFIGREEVLVSVIPDLPLPHAYVDEKDALRPANTPENVWNTIWDNTLVAVGSTWASLQEHTSDVATQMSLVHDRRPHSIDEIMEYALKVADGLYTARVLVYTEDISSDVGDMPLPLVVHRYYSSYISKRRTSGPCGKGWLLAWWELRVIQATESEIILQQDREFVTFRTSGAGLYANGDSQITVADKEIIYNDPNAVEVFIFDRITGQLARIENLVDESSITVQYNDKQEPMSFRHSNGDTMTITYTDSGILNFADIIDQDGNVKQSSSYSYDSSGVHLMTVAVGDQSVRYNYNGEGDLIEVVEATNEKTRFSYDDRGLLVKSAEFSDSDNLLSAVAITYDWNGIVTMSLLPENRTLGTYIDTQGRPKSFSSSPGSAPIVQIDLPASNGRMLVTGDQVLSETRMDAETNTLHVKDGIGNEVVYTLGDSGEIISLLDSGGQTYGAVFDDNIGVKEFVNPDGTKLVVDYGSDGQVSGMTNPDGSKILFSYDSQDNLISKVADGVESKYEYDANRRLTRGSNEEGTVEIEYSREGVPVKVAYPNGHQLSYGYNAKFQRLYIADDSGYNISYTYNDRDQVAEVRREDSGEWIVRFNYTVHGKLAGKAYANGAYTKYEYDSDGRLLTLRNFNHRGTLLSMFAYEYDLKDQIVVLKTLTGSWSFKYDAISQMTSWVAPTGEVTEVRYDSRGNRLTQTSQDSTKSYSVNRMNQYLAYGDSDAFTYDINGNLKQKVTSGRTESYSFNSEGRLIEVETPDKRCSYKYDTLGNLYRKVCSDGGNYSYLVDPFGPYGADIIAEISGDTVTYFVHSMEQGLLAAFQKNRDWYYQFNGDNSIVAVLDMAGDTTNSYDYDPFGRVIAASENIRNIYQYVGQLGVIRDEAVENVFMMRARHYDATHGRFISLDPLGFAANTPNLYVYAGNNPLVVKDPTGEVLPFVPFLAAAGIRALTSVAGYAVTTHPSKYTLGGILGAAVGGAVKVPIVGDILGSITEDLVDKGAVDWHDVAKDATWGAAFGPLGKKLGKLIPDGAGKWLKNLGGKAKGKVPKWLTGPLRRAWDKLKEKGPEFLRDPDFFEFIKDQIKSKIKGQIKKYVEDFLKDLFNDLGLPEKVKQFWKELLEWIASFDPNDMIGPSGFGDANFIPANLVLEYKIRFENDANATAPAQRVFIRHQLDDDLDERSLRVGSFGFGDFTQNVTVQRAFLQDVVNVTESLGVLVRVRAGIDVVNNEATWELQAIDPETGESPVDPSVGFLPPNNGTTGQGFVTFTVRAKQQLGPLPTIDAKASIIFDQNEPIDTPPIFNTIDNVAPTVNMTTIQDLLIAGTPAVRFDTSDVGAGVATVDLYLLENGHVTPLLQGLTEGTAILPPSQISHYQVIAAAVDKVGNMQTLEDAVNNVLQFNITTVEITCLNDCSGQGNCSAIGTCQCQSGFYGSDCSQVSPPVEPPILDFTSTGGLEDNPIAIHVTARPVRNVTMTDDLIITVAGLPTAAVLSKGSRMIDGTWKLTQDEFGDLELQLPIHFSGRLQLKATAYYINQLNTTLRSGDLGLVIEPLPDASDLVVEDACYSASTGNTIDLVIKSGLIDMSGSERFSLILRGIPENVTLDKGNQSSGGDYVLTLTDLPNVQLRVLGEFQPFTIEVIASSTVATTLRQANTSKLVTIKECEVEKDEPPVVILTVKVRNGFVAKWTLPASAEGKVKKLKVVLFQLKPRRRIETHKFEPNIQAHYFSPLEPGSKYEVRVSMKLMGKKSFGPRGKLKVTL